MNNFTFFSPTYFVFGKEEENNVGQYVKRFGGTKVLIHYGGGSVVRSGLLERVKRSLQKDGLSFVELGGKEEDIPYLAHTAAYGNGNGGTLGGFVVLQEKDMENIYRLML